MKNLPLIESDKLQKLFSSSKNSFDYVIDIINNYIPEGVILLNVNGFLHYENSKELVMDHSTVICNLETETWDCYDWGWGNEVSQSNKGTKFLIFNYSIPSFLGDDAGNSDVSVYENYHHTLTLPVAKSTNLRLIRKIIKFIEHANFLRLQNQEISKKLFEDLNIDHNRYSTKFPTIRLRDTGHYIDNFSLTLIIDIDSPVISYKLELHILPTSNEYCNLSITIDIDIIVAKIRRSDITSLLIDITTIYHRNRDFFEINGRWLTGPFNKDNNYTDDITALLKYTLGCYDQANGVTLFRL